MRPTSSFSGGHGDHTLCAVAPSPALRERVLAASTDAAGAFGGELLGATGSPRHFGFNDGVIRPPDTFPSGAFPSDVRNAAAQRAPLRGPVRVVVVLAEFSDHHLVHNAAHFHDLFFSKGVIATGSVTEYYEEVTGGLIEIVGEVVGPYTMPKTLAWYANSNYGIGKPTGTPRANVLAHDAAVAADPDVDFTPYDNDGNGYVDAFIVVHAGSGGEETGNSGDIWSHKWVLPAEYQADHTKIYAYLTIPEDAKLGVSAHELGHLLFGFPDLYDIDNTSEGIGNWCLMAAGSWNGNGDTPAHPSAWCKANQGWVAVDTVTAATTQTFTDVKDSRTVWRLWTDAAAGQEYFLVENRRKAGFDAQLPGDGLLIWHIDEGQKDNSDESHYLVGLLQADGALDLEHAANRGDAADSYPGTSGNRTLDASSDPATTTYAGQASKVSLVEISDSAASMTAKVSVGLPTEDDGGGGNGGGGGGGEGGARARLDAIEAELAKLRAALTAAGADLSQVGASATNAARTSPWSPLSTT